MAEIPAQVHLTLPHLIGERDYALERSHRRGFLRWPLNLTFGLNAFELFQGVSNLLIRVIDTSISLLPAASPRLQSGSYIETSMNLTRFRNYHDKVI